MAQALEDMPEVVALRQEPGPRLHHPLHARTAKSSNYIPDFIACIDDGHGADDLLNLIVEVTGEKKKDKEAKVATARDLWVPAVNNHGGFGRWAFIEVTDPWDAQNLDPRRSEHGAEPSRQWRPIDGTKKTHASPTPVESIRHKDTRDEHPDRGAARLRRPTTRRARRRCSTRATRRSTRSSSGRARTSRTAHDLAVPVVPIYIQEKIHPQALIEDLPRTAQRTGREPQLDLFADFNGGSTTSSRRSTSTTTSRTGRTA